MVAPACGIFVFVLRYMEIVQSEVKCQRDLDEQARQAASDDGSTTVLPLLPNSDDESMIELSSTDGE